MTHRTETFGNQTLILGDCREILPTLGKVDAVVTDPPYGVGIEYESMDDTPEFIESVILPILIKCRELSKRVCLTPGVKNMFLYPRPDHTGSIYYPAGAGCNSWGFSCWQPIFYYGKDPYGGTGSLPDSFSSTESSEKNGHPCPKPIGQMTKILKRSTLENEVVLDTFMGSGTTLIACQKLGRKGIGIELNEKYFDIACRRVEQAAKQPDFFIETAPKPQQLKLAEVSA